MRLLNPTSAIRSVTDGSSAITREGARGIVIISPESSTISTGNSSDDVLIVSDCGPLVLMLIFAASELGDAVHAIPVTNISENKTETIE